MMKYFWENFRKNKYNFLLSHHHEGYGDIFNASTEDVLIFYNNSNISIGKFIYVFNCVWLYTVSETNRQRDIWETIKDHKRLKHNKTFFKSIIFYIYIRV